MYIIHIYYMYIYITLRLTEYFDDHNVTTNDQKNESLVQGKSMFYPPRNRNKELETHISFINNRYCK